MFDFAIIIEIIKKNTRFVGLKFLDTENLVKIRSIYIEISAIWKLIQNSKELIQECL